MTDRSPWLVALATANFLVLVALAFLARARFESIESRLDARDAASAGAKRGPAAERGEPPAPPPIPPARGGGTGREAPVEGEEPKPGSNADIVKRLQKLSDDLYDVTTENSSEHHDFKRTLTQIHSTVRKIQAALVAPGSPTGEWGLGPRNTGDKPLTSETIEAYRRDAAWSGVQVEAGRVIVRGFLNMGTYASMPIEYFVTRWPESGHETLLHVLGQVPLDENLSPEKLKGLPTAIYKGMVVAGFREGDCGRFGPPAPDDKERKPRWVAPTGDDVYVGVRYTLGGTLHVARATDWVIDPDTKTVLPEKAFKFTGSLRQDDFQSGDEQVSAEAGGIVVSVYGNPNTLVEIAIEDNLENRYQYNHLRIPNPLRLEMGKGGPVLEGLRDRAHNALALHTMVRDGKASPIERAPTLLGVSPNGQALEVTFGKIDGGWRVSSDLLTKGDWRIRADVDGKPVESTGIEPLYVDLIFSKTPIEPAGDGAKPIEAPELPAVIPTGAGLHKEPAGMGPPKDGGK